MNKESSMQTYECLKTGKLYRFTPIHNGRYQREDGVEFTMTKMFTNYKWIRNTKTRRNTIWVVNPNTGFKVERKL